MNPCELSLTAKLQLIVDPDDVRALKDTMHAYTKACNFLSAYVFRTRDLEKRHLHDLYYHQLREDFGIKAQMAQSVIKTVIAMKKHRQIQRTAAERRIQMTVGFYQCV